MKLLIAAACLALPITCSADAGQACKQLEYAQLKDSSKSELNEMYCTAVRRDKFNSDAVAELHDGMSKKIRDGENVAPLLRMSDEYIAAKKTCLASADAAWGMLTKKYKIKQPTCK